MELGRLPYRKGKTFEDFVGAANLKRPREGQLHRQLFVGADRER